MDVSLPRYHVTLSVMITPRPKWVGEVLRGPFWTRLAKERIPVYMLLSVRTVAVSQSDARERIESHSNRFLDHEIRVDSQSLCAAEHESASGCVPSQFELVFFLNGSNYSAFLSSFQPQNGTRPGPNRTVIVVNPRFLTPTQCITGFE